MTALEDFLSPTPETAAFSTSSGTATLTLSNSAVLENVDGGTTVGKLSVSGPDPGESFRFELLDDAGGLFKLVGDTIVVADGARLDYETADRHDLLVLATDLDGNASKVDVTVHVTDVPKEYTEHLFTLYDAWLARKYAGDILSGSDASTPVPGLIPIDESIFPDGFGRPVSLAVTGPDAGKLAVQDGYLVAEDGFDFEQRGTYQVTVWAKDADGTICYRPIVIDLVDHGEAPTDIVIDNAFVAENAPDGTVVGSLKAIDPDAGDTATLTLVNSAGGRFKLDGDVLMVRDGSQIDYEADTGHDIVVRATDAGGLWVEKTLHIAVVDMWNM